MPLIRQFNYSGLDNSHLFHSWMFASKSTDAVDADQIVPRSLNPHKMASKPPADPLDSLQFMLNDLIVQIGKALQASSKQPGRRDVAVVQAILQNHMPSSIEAFHSALDGMESNIIGAKAVLRRDLDHLESQLSSDASHLAKEVPGTASQSTLGSANRVEVAQTPVSPVSIAQPQHQALLASTAPTAPMAPVPDMGVDVALAEVKIKREMPSSAPQALMEPTMEASLAADSKQGAVPEPLALHAAPEAPMDDLFNIGDGAGTVGNNSGEFNFTDITFSLAPVNNESQVQSGARQAEMDLSAFGTEDISSLDNILPADNLAPPIAGSGGDISNAVGKTKPPSDRIQGVDKANNDKGKLEPSDSLDDMFNLGGEGGMDLDMNLGGVDSSNFDSMFFTELEDVKYDDAFFNIGE